MEHTTNAEVAVYVQSKYAKPAYTVESYTSLWASYRLFRTDSLDRI